MGVAGTLSLTVATIHLVALVLRVLALRDDDRPLDKAEAPHTAAAAALLFVPETLYRALTSRAGSPSVEVWESADGGRSLSVGAIPPLASVRALARYAPGERVVVVNLCSWWAGFGELYAAHGLIQTRHPCGSADVLAIVTALRKIGLGEGGGGGSGGEGQGGSEDSAAAAGAGNGERVRVLLHCETGAFAAAVAWMVGYPFDVIKTRCQMAGSAGTLLGAARTLFAEGGVSAFYVGLSLKLARAIPMSAINFLAYEQVYALMNKD